MIVPLLFGLLEKTMFTSAEYVPGERFVKKNFGSIFSNIPTSANISDSFDTLKELRSDPSEEDRFRTLSKL